jgi:hypothetical protein
VFAFMPYRFTVIPLTFISAYLLLIPPRKQLPTASRPDA